MQKLEYFTFDITNKYLNGKKTDEINYKKGYYICGIGNNFKRYSLKKINNDIKNINMYNLNSHINELLKTNIKHSNIFKRRRNIK